MIKMVRQMFGGHTIIAQDIIQVPMVKMRVEIFFQVRQFSIIADKTVRIKRGGA